VNLNELSDTLNTKAEKSIAMGKLKNYTGSAYFQCHGKGTNLYTAPMRALFIMTANKSPLEITDDDRRIFLIDTPQAMIDTPQVKERGLTTVVNALLAQINNIAYYLATEVEDITDNDYLHSPSNYSKEGLIFKGFWFAKKIMESFRHPDKFLSHLFELTKNSSAWHVKETQYNKWVTSDDVYSLYEALGGIVTDEKALVLYGELANLYPNSDTDNKKKGNSKQKDSRGHRVIRVLVEEIGDVRADNGITEEDAEEIPLKEIRA